MAIEVQTSPQGTIPYPARRSFGKIPAVLEMPHLVQIQLDSFHWFLDEGIQELLDEISPITDFTGKSMELSFPRDPSTNRSFEFGEARFTEAECRERDMTYSVPLRVRTRLLIKETGEIKDSEIFLGRLPDDDARRHLHHQRRGARRRLPARPLAGHLLHRDGGPLHRAAASMRRN